MTYPERELEGISKSLKEISKTLQQILTLSAHSNSKEEYTGDCERCLCNSCANVETCNVKPDGVLPGIMTGSCSECMPGQRFMPVESAHCDNYAKSVEEEA